MSNPKNFPEHIYNLNKEFCQPVPSLVKTQQFINELMYFLFPIKSDRNRSLYEMKTKWSELKIHFRELLFPLQKELEKPVEELTTIFFQSIPAIHINLIKDAENFLNCDPAAYSTEEVILCYPGYYGIAVYRLAHELYKLKIPVIPRVITEYAHGKTGIDINPGATIGELFYIDHGTGIVIGETTIIGKCVKIYQGVTLGALSVAKHMANIKRHPTIEDNVIIYAGSTILGGKTVIGHDSIIGGNVWLTESVQPYSLVSHKPQTSIRDSFNFEEPINFVI
ncbi:MAG: serine O-acetyltransferase [Bacteroidota bacterium]|nr:serine O-acetyltransferase [Bacteroidota bacterium]MDP4225141.1 serine O-acetyltransferase [Bacteroidota bacterium]MDP4274658.1 serine O-acetyltransferase [Bacteroidota bacterium]